LVVRAVVLDLATIVLPSRITIASSMAGKKSTGIDPADSEPSSRTTRQNAATVNGRRSASRTIHTTGG
jgi:hypothetical protein